MNQFENEENVVTNARQRIAKGNIDNEYVLLLAREVERGRKTISKLQAESARLYAEFIAPQNDPDAPIFDEAECADFIFNNLIERGIAVRVEDIRLIMDFEYKYGVKIGIYPPNEQI